MLKTKVLFTTTSLIFITLSVVGNVAEAKKKTPRPTENVCVANDIYVSCDLLEDCLLSGGEIGTFDGEPVCWEDTSVKQLDKQQNRNNSLPGQKVISTSPEPTRPVNSKLKPLPSQNSGPAKVAQ